MRRSGLILALLPLPLAAQDRAALICETAGGEVVTVTLWNPSEHDRLLHCVDAPGLGDLFACAPNGGWGLTNPEQSDELFGIVTDSGELDHAGGTFFAHVGPSQFVASASSGGGIPLVLEVGGGTYWRMRVELGTGHGVVETRDGEVPIRCDPT